MTFNAALTSPQTTLLRAGWRADQEISICPNTPVMTCRVNGAYGGGPFAQFNYNNVTVGAYTDVIAQQTILISHTNSPKAFYYRGRARIVPSSSVLYISETSENFTDQDYVFVIDHYDCTDRLGRAVSDVQYKDYNLSYAADGPVITGLQTAYQGDSSAATHSGLRIAFAVSAYSTIPGVTISSYQFAFKAASYTVVSGALNTATVTLDIIAGWQWGKLTVTDSNGTAWPFHFAVAVDTYTEGFDGAKISGDIRNGYTATVTGFTGLSSVVNGTFCIIGRPRESYGSTASPTSGVITGNSIDFCGWLLNEANRGQSDPLYSFTSDVEFTLQGFGTVLQRLETQLLEIRYKASPSLWDELPLVTPLAATVHELQWNNTALFLASLASDDYTDTFSTLYLPVQNDTPYGTLMDVQSGILTSINSALEFAADGRMQVTRSVWHLSQAARDALLVVADFDNRDLISIEEPDQHWDTVGKIDADGGYFTSNGQLVAVRSRAPGYAQGSANGSGSLNNQVLGATDSLSDAQTELNQRSGNEFTVQNPNVDLTINMPDGYYWLTPSMSQVYTWTLDGSENVRGLIYTTADHWVCVKVSHQHQNGLEHGDQAGTRTVQATFRLIPPVGAPGDTVPIIPDGSLNTPLPPLPPIPAFPSIPEFNFPEAGLTDAQITPAQTAFKGVAPTDGREVLTWSATQEWDTTTYSIKTSPTWKDDTPPDTFAIKDAIFDPFYSPYNAPTAVGVYSVLSDGTNSHIIDTSNIAAPTVHGTIGVDFAGVYTAIKPCSTQNSVVVFAPEGGGGSASFIVQAITDVPGNDSGVYINNGEALAITASGTWSNNGVDYWGPNGNGTPADPSFVLPGQSEYSLIGRIGTSGSWFYVGSSYSATAAASGNLYLMMNDNTFTDNVGALTASITTPSTGGTPKVRYSADRGASVGSAINVGTGSCGPIAGFDIIQVGTTMLAAADKQVRISTSLSSPSFANAPGGTLSTYQPVLIKIPRLRWDNTSNINTATPDWLLGINGLESSKCLWKVVGAGTLTDITPSGVTACIGPESAAVWWQNSHYIAFLGSVSGTVHLFTMTDGSTWSDQGAISGATTVKMRAGPGSVLQLFIAGSGGLRFSKTFGATTAARTAPGSGLLGCEVLG